MKLVRFQYQGVKKYGLIDGNKVKGLTGELRDLKYSGDRYSLDEADILPPIFPGKIVCVGLNYLDHAEELHMQEKDNPIIFLKPPSSIIGYGEKIKYPYQSQHVDCEAELAVVISRRCKNIKEKNAKEYILGYTCGNDITARDIQKIDGQWTRAKSFDTFCPIGPFITDEVDPKDLGVRAYINGEMIQNSRTSMMIFNVYYLVSFISQIMTLMPGDIILTGTPKGVSPINPGDSVEVAIDGIGSLMNEVAEAE